MTAYMSTATANALKDECHVETVWQSEDGQHSRSKQYIGDIAVHVLLDFKDGLIVYSDGTTKDVNMEQN